MRRPLSCHAAVPEEGARTQRGERGLHRLQQDSTQNLTFNYSTHIYSSTSLHQPNTVPGEQSAVPGAEESTANERDTAPALGEFRIQW